MKTKKVWKLFCFLMASALAIVIFQNCSKQTSQLLPEGISQHSSLQLDPLNPLKSGAGPVTGNGSGYEGKLEFNSYAIHGCHGDVSKPEQTIEKVGDRYYQTRADCTEIEPVELPASEVTDSPPTPNIITVQNAIFETATPTPHPRGHVYSICRAKKVLPSGKTSFADGIIRLNPDKPDESRGVSYTLHGEFNTLTPNRHNPEEMLRRVFDVRLVTRLGHLVNIERTFESKRTALIKNVPDNTVNFRINFFKPEYTYMSGGTLITGKIQVPTEDFLATTYLPASCVRLEDFKF